MGGSYQVDIFGFSFLILTGLYAGSRQAVGAGVHWKERLYSKETGVE